MISRAAAARSLEACMEIDTDKLNAFMGKMLVDVGAAMSASLMLIGDKLGLYKALVRGGPMTSAELANATSTTERYVREWLAAQAAAGYADYDSSSTRFSMSPGQAMVFADQVSPAVIAPILYPTPSPI